VQGFPSSQFGGVPGWHTPCASHVSCPLQKFPSSQSELLLQDVITVTEHSPFDICVISWWNGSLISKVGGVGPSTSKLYTPGGVSPADVNITEYRLNVPGPLRNGCVNEVWTVLMVFAAGVLYVSELPALRFVGGSVGVKNAL